MHDPAIKTQTSKRLPKAIIHREDIIRRVAQGEYLASIAKDIGLKGKGQAICNILSTDPEYIAAREQGLENRLATRERELEAADPADVPRARELLSHARWRAEREAPHRWGQHNRLTVEHSGDLGERLRRAKERVIEAIPEPVAAQETPLIKDNQAVSG